MPHQWEEQEQPAVCQRCFINIAPGMTFCEDCQKDLQTERELAEQKRLCTTLYNACREARAAIKQHAYFLERGQLAVISPSVLAELEHAIAEAEKINEKKTPPKGGG